MPKLMFVVTEDWYFASHRLQIAREALAAGYEVVVATRLQREKERLEAEGFRTIPILMRRRGGNPWREALTIWDLVKLYRAERPDIVHHVALKPVLFGSLAALLAGVPRVVNTAAGLGYFFSSTTLKARLLRPLIQLGLKLLIDRHHCRLIVQNRDDLALLTKAKVVRRERVALIRGSGVDILAFHPMPEPAGEVTVALVARMLWDKGIHRAVEAVRLLRAEGVGIRLQLVGAPDLDNPTAIPEARLLEWAALDGIEWTGFQDDIVSVWRDCHIAVLPSTREGLPKSLLEAAACGRPLVATDVPGCRELVIDGVNGLLVPLKNTAALAAALRRLAADPALRAKLGHTARSIVEDELSDTHVTRQHIQLYADVMAEASTASIGKPRILFLTENFPPETNAAATRVYERAVYWVQWGYDVTVITCAPNFPQGRLFPGYRNAWHRTETMDGIKVVRVKTFIAANAGVLFRTLDFLSFMVTGSVAGLLHRPRPDVVVATSPQFFAAVAGWVVAALKRRPFVFELSDLWPASIVAVGAMKPSLSLRLIEKLELFLYSRAQAVVALTNAFKDNLVSRGVDPAKVAVVTNGVDLPRYQPRPRDLALARQFGLEGKFVVGYVGTHGMAHGLKNVLDAAALLIDRDDVRVILVGNGAEREALIANAQARGLANVVFVPPQPKDAIPAIWSLCDVALVHLRNSPVFTTVIPSKMFEAMGMGLPLLMVLPDGEAKGIVEAEATGLWVPPEDPAALAAAIRHLASDPDLCRRLSQASLANAPRHTREFQARSMLDVLDTVGAGKTRTSQP